MVPTLFGISPVLWLVITAAPGDPGAQAAGEAQTQTGGGNESRRIFRAQFNLDKPLFWNGYTSLSPRTVLREAVRAVDPGLPPRDRSRAYERLQDWGWFAVPGLVQALDLATTPEQRIALLLRLPENARRLGATRVGRPLTEEEKALNREVYAEAEEIRRNLRLDPARARGPEGEQEIAAKSEAWKAWYAPRASRWQWSAAEKLRIALFDTQFARYWSNLLKLDLGDSHVHRLPVGRLILGRLPISITLAVTSLVLAYLISIPLGIWSAVNHRSPAEQGVSTVLFMLYSLPSFFVASLVLRFFGIGEPFRIIPVQGFESENTFSMTTWGHVKDVLWHTVAPLFCLTYASLAGLSRYAKSGLLNVIRSDYVRTARAKGLSEGSVVLKHALRNGVIPIITLLGTTLPVLVGGSIIVESVFRIPGIGYLIWDSILQRDYNVVIGETMIVAVLTMIGILLSDILYAVVDPRISYS
jgi:peptide/nickel transport system permease protein